MRFEIEVHLIGSPYYHIMKGQSQYTIFEIAQAVYDISAAIGTINVKLEDIEAAVLDLFKVGVATIGETASKTSSYITVRRAK